MKHLKHLNKYLVQYKWHIVWGTVFIIFSNLLGVYAPQLVRQSVDMVKQATTDFESGNVNAENLKFPDAIEWGFTTFNIDKSGIINTDTSADIALTLIKFGLMLGILYLIIAALRGVFVFFMRQTIIVMSRLIEFHLKNEIFAHYQKLSTAFYKRNNTGDLMNRVSEDVSKVRMYLGPAIMYTINLAVLFILVISTMLSINVELSLYVLAPLPIMSVCIYYVSSIINKKSEKMQRQQSTLSTFVQEAFSGIRVLKAYNREKWSSAEFEKECNTYKDKALSLVKTEALFHPVILLLIGVSTILTIYIGGLKHIDGTISVGNMVEFVIYINMLTWPFASVGWVTSLIQRATASQQRINEFLHTQPEIENKSSKNFNIKGKITFKNVGFTYPNTGIQALKNINFSINHGKTLAIIGRTGSGKSTIANLINRQYETTKGSILIDDENINNINLSDLRNAIGYVPQDVFLFSDTIENNIAFGIDDYKLEEVENAAKRADVHDNIVDFKNGYQTLLGERGITLSGGQKQRVSIARALIKQPNILIFDDCLSAVDTETEEKILNELKQVMRLNTCILISHRVSTVKNADKIIVLEEGKIIEKGTHDELLNLNSVYAKLHEKQLLESQLLVD